MEAMRLSLLEHEAQQQRERQAAARNAASNPDDAPSRDTASASPDPASQLNQDEVQQSGQLAEPDLLGVTTASLPPSSGANTPLEGNPSRASESNSHQSASVSPRPSFDASSSTPSSHRRTGSGPIQSASSPLNGAAALAMAVGFPSSTPAESSAGPTGFAPRTLNTLSAAVGASSIPLAILNSSTNDLPGPTESERPRSSEPQVRSTSTEPNSDAGASQLLEGHTEDQFPPPSHESSSAARPPVPLDTAVSQPSSDSVGSLPNPFDSPVLKFTVDDVSANSPVVTRTSEAGNQSSAHFLTPEARAVTAGSIMTVDSQQSKGDDYDVLISSPETETDQPLMSGPPNLARLDTEDFSPNQVSSAGGSGAL